MKKQQHFVTYEDVLKVVKSYLTKDEVKQLKEAYEDASKLYFGVTRLNGDNYITHVNNIVLTLAMVNADLDTLISSYLHDTIKDQKLTYDELKEKYNENVANIVGGFTKINDLNLEVKSESDIKKNQKILVGLCSDVRILFIKLADRLHNLRTMWVHNDKIQKEVAKETMDVLIPIAHRLGMFGIKQELEDLSLRYYKPEVYYQIVEKINQTKKERDDNIEKMINEISKLLKKRGIKFQIKGRAKSIHSIYKKLDSGRMFSDIFDLLALRVFVNDEDECYEVLSEIHSKYKPIPKRFKDYIARPKPNMYQSLHTTVYGEDDHLYEIQVRTYEMDLIAENGIASHWSYKAKGSNQKATIKSAMDKKLNAFKKTIEKDEEELLEPIDEESDVIYVYTPKKDVFEMQKGSTPIDFAYRIHSEVGDKMVGAIVNDNIVPLDYELNDGDIIKINTNKNSEGPSKEWINMAFTYHARSKVKSHFNKKEKDNLIKKGEDLLAKSLRKRKVSSSDFFKNENLDKTLKELKLDNLEDLYLNIGNNKYTPTLVINVVFSNHETKEETLIKKTTNNRPKKKISIKGDIVVEGISGVMINMASCCKPVPGDDILGYITKGFGISVHRINCHNVKDVGKRIIDVYWNDKITKKYPTNILIHSSDNKKLLADLINKTANTDITIQNVNTVDTKRGDFMLDVVVEVPNKEELKKFMNEIRSMKNVTDAERVIK